EDSIPVKVKPVEQQQQQQQQQQNDEEKKKTTNSPVKSKPLSQEAAGDSAVLKEIISKVDDPEDEAAKKEPFYLKDPKKALQAFFDREGCDLVYDVEDRQFGSYYCTIKLPIIDEYGHTVVAECEDKHCKKREIINRCILEACQILDEYGVLREGTAVLTQKHQQLKRQLLEENDFYEDEEDSFFDRTGELEKKRIKRMQRLGNVPEQVETFDSLREKLRNLYREQRKIQQQLDKGKQKSDNRAAASTDKETDELDQYIKQLKQGETINMRLKWQLRKRLLELEQDEKKFERLLKICKPADFNFQIWKQDILDATKHEDSIPVKVKPVEQQQQMQHIPNAPTIQVSADKTEAVETIPTKQKRPQQNLIGISDSKKSLPSENSSLSSKSNKKRKEFDSKDQIDDSEHYTDSNYAEWMPPSSQSGDGTTILNEKYGY
ncbi:unnamed protein product, partial [Didymodactylos carnosus]